MKPILTTISLLFALTSCELPDVNEASPEHDYTPPTFEVPAKMIGEYESASHNPNKGTVSITAIEIIIATEQCTDTIPVTNEMYYNNCYIKITLPHGSILQIWEYDGYEFIHILIDGSSLGRFERITEPILN